MRTTTLSIAALLVALAGCGGGEDDGAADAGGADVTDASVGERWASPTMLRGDGERPRAAIDGSGSAIVAWQEGSEPTVLRARRYDAGAGAWSDLTLIALGDQLWFDYDLAMSSAGDAVITWIDETDPGVWSRRYDISGGWSDAERIRDTTDAVEVSATMNASGAAAVAWTDGTTDDEIVYVSRHDDGTWGAAEPISDDPGGSTPLIAMADDGTIHAAWLGDGVLARTHIPDTGWSAVHMLDDSTAWELALAVAPDGSAAVVWGFLSGLSAARYDTAWGASTELDMAGGPAPFGVRLAIDSAGNAVSVWTNMSNNTGSRDVWHSRSAGAGWSIATKVDDQTPDALDPALSVDGDGITVAWAQVDDSDVEALWTRSLAPDGTWTTAEVIDTSDTGYAWLDLTANPDGDAVVVWTGDGLYALGTN
jgi:hypothetical protein